MTDSEQDRDPIEALAAAFVKRLRRGEEVSVEAYAAENPDQADEIRELFPTIAAMEKLKLRKERSSSGRATLGPVNLERLGDFRILGEIGRGGMGVVFEAEQESLGRTVAIKVLPRHALLDEAHLRRFERETRIAANLHHTNIVPVFGTGEQDGFHYFVMQRIEGVGLDRVIDCLAGRRKGDDPLVEKIAGLLTAGEPYWKKAAQIGMQAARALDYAHSRGTLHRDIKPANLLLDAQGVLWISDFGVARALETDDVTRTGDLSGTFRFLAPERFQGREDARSDQYGLGLALYELLTLKPAFDDGSRTRLIHRITQEAPIAPRKLNPKIPIDLETIVLTAMARDPDHRYATAGALADDLGCFLEDRPVQARRISSLERLWRWSRRNPMVAGLSTAVLVLLVLVAAISSLGYLESKKANIRVTSALKGETEQREKAQATSELALEVLDRIYAQLAPFQQIGTAEYTIQDSEGDLIEVPLQPVISRETAALMENLLVFYDRLSDQHGEDARLVQKVAQANARVGSIRLLLGQYDLARTAFNRSLARYEELHETTDEARSFKVETAAIYNEIGTAFRLDGQIEKAYEAYNSALDLLKPSREAARNDLPPGHWFELARTYYLIGTGRRPRPPGALAGPRPGLPPPARPPLDGWEVDCMDKAIDLLKELIQEQPSVPGYRHLLACCFRDRPPKFGLEPDGIGPIDDAAKILEELVEEYPRVPQYGHDLCETYARIDVRGPWITAERLPEVENYLEKGLALSAELIARYPNVPSYKATEVHIILKLGDLLARQGLTEEGEAQLRKALSIQSALVDRFPEASSYRVWLAEIERSLARMLSEEDRLLEARPLLEKSLVALEVLWEQEPRPRFLRDMLGATCHDLADLLRAIGDADGEKEALSREQTYRDAR